MKFMRFSVGNPKGELVELPKEHGSRMEEIEAFVGGMSSDSYLVKGYALVTNDRGYDLGLPVSMLAVTNRNTIEILGNFYIYKYDDFTRQTIDMTEEDVKYFRDRLLVINSTPTLYLQDGYNKQAFIVMAQMQGFTCEELKD